ncbi:MAG: HAD-IC family P-type ATPase [Pseudonocardiaceae bacterium]
MDSMRAEAALAVDFSGVPSSPVGDRRFVLPLSTFTTLVVAAATASWWHQCTHRNRGPGPTRKMANSLGIPRYFANVLPEEKVELVSNLQSEGRSVCFVGDGINDSISLKKANVSVSLRGASTVAIDSAQIILTGQGLQQLPFVFQLADEFDSNLRSEINVAVGQGIVVIGGALLSLVGIVGGTLIWISSLATGLGIAYTPLLRHQINGDTGLEPKSLPQTTNGAAPQPDEACGWSVWVSGLRSGG